MLKVDNNTFIFADPHYGHHNMVAGETTWFFDEELTEDEIEKIRWERCRPFNTMQEHNESIIERINEKVPANATLICLGDWSFGGKGNIWHFRREINCNDIHLILGNHDHHIRDNKSLNIPIGDKDRYDEIVGYETEGIEEGAVYISVKVQDFFSSVSDYKQMRFKREGNTYHFVLFHYALRVWDKSHYGSIMLYGHSHGTLDEMTPKIANPTWVGDKYYIRNFRTMDVGVDTNNFYPYHIEEIVDDMRERPIGMEVDQHG